MVLIFQLGTNNWQVEGGGFAPGSGILHEAHHNAYNKLPNTKSFSVWPLPSKLTHQPAPDRTDYRLFKLEHDIPICESVSPVSNFRWHTMSESDFATYRKRLADFCYEYMEAAEKETGKNFDIFIAHHAFLNPLVGNDILQRRKAAGKPPCQLCVFVHGTALKMYVHEKGGKNPAEYPMRFLPIMEKERIFAKDSGIVSRIFAISTAQVDAFKEIFAEFPDDRVTVSPNGIDFDTFHAPDPPMSRDQVLAELKHVPYDGAPTAIPAGYDYMVTFVGKFANWKRLDSLLYAAAGYEKTFAGKGRKVCTIVVGSGPDEAIRLYQDLALKELDLKHCYFLGAQDQPTLAKLYAVSSIGCFPSRTEPFGLVFVECMACQCPVIGANSGGPKDFVSDAVGCLVPEPGSYEPADVKILAKDLDKAITQALADDWKGEKGAACLQLARDRFGVAKQVSGLIDSVVGGGAGKVKFMIFQLGTNNWQVEGGGFAPGSGILHEAHHNAYNKLPNTKSFSVWPLPSKLTHQPAPDRTDYRLFKLEHDIPICESVSPVSNFRWHTMSESDFATYRERLADFCYEYMEAAEKETGKNFDIFIAHHAFLNPLVGNDILQRRKAAGKPPCQLCVFVHGTALKMYVHEKGGKNPAEYPMRFLPIMEKERIFAKDSGIVSRIFAISTAQVDAFKEIFAEFPDDRVTVSFNGIDFDTFHAPDPPMSRDQVLAELKHVPYDGAPTAIPAGYDYMVTFVGKFANWKRLDSLLYAAAGYEKTFAGKGRKVCTIVVGSGPDEAIRLYQDLALKELDLKHCYFLGAQDQPTLAKLYAVSSIGCFPSRTEPFGLVFVECMACQCPVIGANSGGPKDFVSDAVGCLVPEPGSYEPADVKILAKDLDKAITQALADDWKGKKGAACLQLARDRFGVTKQVSGLIDSVMPATLHYFPAGGRAELCRLIAAAGRVELIEGGMPGADVDKSDFASPSGVPLLQHGPLKMAQSTAIENYLSLLAFPDLPPEMRAIDSQFCCIKEDVAAGTYKVIFSPMIKEDKEKAAEELRKNASKWYTVVEKLCPANGFMNGQAYPTAADVAVLNMCDTVMSFGLSNRIAGIDWSTYPKMRALATRTAKFPSVAEYLAKSTTFTANPMGL